MRRILMVVIVALAIGIASGVADACSGTGVRYYPFPSCHDNGGPCGVVVCVNGEQVLPPPLGP